MMSRMKERCEAMNSMMDKMNVRPGNFGDAIVMNERKIHVGEFLSGHQTGGDFRQRNSSSFADVGNGARRPRIHFQNVHRVTLDRVLHVHQADDFQRHGKPLSVIANSVENCRR